MCACVHACVLVFPWCTCVCILLLIFFFFFFFNVIPVIFLLCFAMVVVVFGCLLKLIHSGVLLVNGVCQSEFYMCFFNIFISFIVVNMVSLS